MSIELTINSDEMTNSDIQQLTEELCNTLIFEANLQAEVKKGRTIKGAKGDPVTIGVILLSFISSGGAVALFNTIQSYFQRSKKMVFAIEKEDGTRLTLDMENISKKTREDTLNMLKDFLGG